MSPVLVVVTVVVVVLVLAGVGTLTYRARRETDEEIIAARDEAKTRNRELKQVTKVRQAAVGGARKELSRATKDRESAIRASTKRMAELRDPKGRSLGKYQGVTLHERWIETPHGKGSVAGMTATVDSQPSSRITATRLVAFGIFALAAQKKTGAVYLSLVGPTFASVVTCPQDENQAAREFAVLVTNAARSAAVVLEHLPAQIEAEEKAMVRAQDTSTVDRLRARLAEVEADDRLQAPIRAAQSRFDEAEARLDALKAAKGQVGSGDVYEFDPADEG